MVSHTCQLVLSRVVMVLIHLINEIVKSILWDIIKFASVPQRKSV